MHHYPEPVRHPGVYHPMFITAPHDPVQQAWFEEACDQVEALIRWTDAPREAWPLISLAVHLVADSVIADDGVDPAWENFDVAAFIDDVGDTILVGGAHVPLFASAFYTMLVEKGDVDLDIAGPILAALQMFIDRATPGPSRATRRAEAAAARRARRQRRKGRAN